MTTIAYKAGFVACDSRLASGDMISTDTYVKRLVAGRVHFFIAGDYSSYEALVEAYMNKTPMETGGHVAALVFDGRLLRVGVHSKTGRVWTEPVHERLAALGSGCEFAYGAMAFGASAKQAVDVAKSLDLHTGGKVRVYDYRKQLGVV